MNKYLLMLVVAFLSVNFASAQSSLSVCADGSCLSVNAASASGAHEYAVRLNGSRAFRHDPRFGGAEVIYKSSGIATEADARRWWMNSPPHRKLLLSGAIQDVACVGGVCVGRSVGAVKSNVAEPFKQGVSNGFSLAKQRSASLLRIRYRFNRCK